MKQLNIRLEDDAYESFRRACEATHVSMNQQLAILCDAYAAHHMTGKVSHLNGAECPLSAMIRQLAAAAAEEIRTTGEFRRQLLNPPAQPNPPATKGEQNSCTSTTPKHGTANVDTKTSRPRWTSALDAGPTGKQATANGRNSR